jgi:hypothetical protein
MSGDRELLIVAAPHGAESDRFPPLRWESVRDLAAAVLRVRARAVGKAAASALQRGIVPVVDATSYEDEEELSASLGALDESAPVTIVVYPGAARRIDLLVVKRRWDAFYAVVEAYEPVILESRRLVRRGSIGSVSKASIVIPAANRFMFDASGCILANALAAVLGNSSTADPDSAILALSNARDAAPRISGVVSGDRGSIRFDSSFSYIELDSIGLCARRIPLPEGDGSYYCMKDVISSARRGAVSRLLPVELISGIRSAGDRSDGR